MTYTNVFVNRKFGQPLIVNGSVIKIYKKKGKEITIYNDYEVDAVYVNSDINLDEVLKGYC